MAGLEHKSESDAHYDPCAMHKVLRQCRSAKAADQAVVTTMAQHVEVPLRRYPWGRPESKYIESPDSSACSWPSMCTFNRPLSV